MDPATDTISTHAYSQVWFSKHKLTPPSWTHALPELLTPKNLCLSFLQVVSQPQLLHSMHKRMPARPAILPSLFAYSMVERNCVFSQSHAITQLLSSLSRRLLCPKDSASKFFACPFSIMLTRLCTPRLPASKFSVPRCVALFCQPVSILPKSYRVKFQNSENFPF